MYLIITLYTLNLLYVNNISMKLKKKTMSNLKEKPSFIMLLDDRLFLMCIMHMCYVTLSNFKTAILSFPLV